MTGVKNIFNVKKKLCADPRFERGFEEVQPRNAIKAQHKVKQKLRDYAFIDKIRWGDIWREVFLPQLMAAICLYHSAVLIICSTFNSSGHMCSNTVVDTIKFPRDTNLCYADVYIVHDVIEIAMCVLLLVHGKVNSILIFFLNNILFVLAFIDPCRLCYLNFQGKWGSTNREKFGWGSARRRGSFQCPKNLAESKIPRGFETSRSYAKRDEWQVYKIFERR